jgi:hypothetical protein
MQVQEAMKAQRIIRKSMAKLMQTSRTQVDKLLNPLGNVTLETLHRAVRLQHLSHVAPLSFPDPSVQTVSEQPFPPGPWRAHAVLARAVPQISFTREEFP